MTMMERVIINGTVESCMAIYLGMVGRYGGCFEEGIWYRRKLRGTREASNGGRVRVRIIHELNISYKELT